MKILLTFNRYGLHFCTKLYVFICMNLYGVFRFAKIFEAFYKKSMTSYGLGLKHSTAHVMPWDVMLNCIGIVPKKLSHVSMVLFIRKGICGIKCHLHECCFDTFRHFFTLFLIFFALCDS